jgi:hypothetical protein
MRKSLKEPSFTAKVKPLIDNDFDAEYLNGGDIESFSSILGMNKKSNIKASKGERIPLDDTQVLSRSTAIAQVLSREFMNGGDIESFSSGLNLDKKMNMEAPKGERIPLDDTQVLSRSAAIAQVLSREFIFEERKGSRQSSTMVSSNYGSMYNIFLQFTSNQLKGTEVRKEFDQFKRSDFNIFIGSSVFLVTGTAIAILHIWTDSRTTNPMFYISLVCGIIAVICIFNLTIQAVLNQNYSSTWIYNYGR